MREEIEVGDGEDVRLDGGVGGHHETAAHDSDMQVLAAIWTLAILPRTLVSAGLLAFVTSYVY